MFPYQYLKPYISRLKGLFPTRFPLRWNLFPENIRPGKISRPHLFSTGTLWIKNN